MGTQWSLGGGWVGGLAKIQDYRFYARLLFSALREIQIVYGRHPTAWGYLVRCKPWGALVPVPSPAPHEGEVNDRILHMEVLAFPGRHLLPLSL